ncbi:Rieske (2Fe-2S) protein [Bradyrhizobium sp. CCBAU 21359]|uniref:aromatic ring-hydroxylating dioxygenase subunit alpha n=1 Tax=Bradyrhizobium sp. CCBAU 21359 TaxID=1325080 RepID=UPI002305897F|nr:aromatic ring-hydroxylating dioxygenase subunit alpha [Bradyrhizobium sp. CCBAU 21359]MDA9459585.1 Rieske (2Fe-2S) protein [Bradyrhizobium sp. CCBAU 21359]
MVASFPVNAWYAAAWDADIGRKLFSRQICGKKMVFYRKLNGEVVALHDACWHRLLPLSLGKLDGDTVICGYHGLAFEPGGKCTYMPSQETINPSACVHSYPIVERHRLIWVWPGDPALADPNKVPDLHWQNDPDWVGDGDTIKFQCNYRLILDNLMDLTHETFVHANFLGQAEVAEVPFRVEHDGQTATVTRWMIGVEPAPYWKKKLGRDGLVDRWQIIRFQGPNTVAIDGGVALTGTGAPEGDRREGVNNIVCNTITPESERSSFYFWSFPRNYKLKDQRETIEQKNDVIFVFKQDELVLNAQQIAMDENPDKEFYNLNIDAGAMWARRIIDRMIAAEAPSNTFSTAAE